MIQDVFLDAVGEIDERYIAEAHASAVRTSPRLRQAWILAACVAALALLTGAVWAAARWFRISDAPGVVIETRWRNEEVDQPQNLIRFEDPGPGNYVGFLVNGRRSPEDAEVTVDSLHDDLALYGLLDQAKADPEELAQAVRYYSTVSPDGEILRARVLERSQIGYRSYYTRYDTELVKEETMNGMDVAWLEVEEEKGVFAWNLICRSEKLRCILMVTSNRSFEAAEELASRLTLVDSGVPMPQGDTIPVFAFRLPMMPDGADSVSCIDLARSYAGWTLRDPGLSLDELCIRAQYNWPLKEHRLTVMLYEPSYYPELYAGHVLVKTGTVNGHPAAWYEPAEPKKYTVRNHVFLVLSFSEGCEIVIDTVQPVAEKYPDILETVASQLELITVEFTDWPPAAFRMLDVG